ncbi:MAG: Gfo/Idh/MocA family oxidoreductase [Candidatus Methylacidiphilales bacterium]|nr:Gfo/Idh/MocA family oxidoreductase [Candidatus Methylacidiphilales bacterium]
MNPRGIDRPLRWGILSTGRIARTFASQLPQGNGTLVAVASRSIREARAFATTVPGATPHGSYQELLDNPSVEAVYIATPHPFHVEWATRAAAAGKHILCEKPMGMSASQVELAITAARIHGVFLMEAFMYRCHPVTAFLIEWVRAERLGRLQHIAACFSFDAPVPPEHRLVALALGGGGILDIGCYPISLIRLLAGASANKPFAEPLTFKGTARLLPTGADGAASALLTFADGLTAEAHCGVALQRGAWVELTGTRGRLRIDQPWLSRWLGRNALVWHQPHGRFWSVPHPVFSARPVYALQAAEVARCVRSGLKQSPKISWDDSLGNARVLDAWLAEAGVHHPNPA